MQSSRFVVAVVVLVLAALAALFFLDGGDAPPPIQPPGAGGAREAGAGPESGALAAGGDAAAAVEGQALREVVAGNLPPTGVRGVVVDAKTGQPLGGVEVIAIKDLPSMEPLVARFRGLFQQGLFVDTRAPRRELGRTVSNHDGTFEILGLPAGRVFLDGRSDGWFVRTPGSARLAVGEIEGGVELRASPGGRVRGIVLSADGAPAAGASVSVRPGLNAFLGQITDRQYRWLETVTDQDGRFDIPGVPMGSGYTVSASAPSIALEEVHGVEVAAGAVTTLTLRGHQGALVGGVVVDAEGKPVEGANVAMVYLDISRMLFSADGRAEPIVTGADGTFRMEHVAAGRVAFIAVAQDRAPSTIAELAVVDGGVYEDLVLQLAAGASLAGRVVDDQKQPVAGATVELRPFERPNDPQFLKMMLMVRRVEATTDADGMFVARGLTGDQLVVQATKPGYTTAVRFGVKLDEKDLVVEVQRGVTIRGKVVADGKPLPRFRVDTRTRPIPAEKGDDGNAGDGNAGDGGATVEAGFGRDGNRDRGGPPWARRGGRSGTIQLAEGQSMSERDMDGNWREVQAADGTFTLRGVPPGRVRVRVRADGYLEPGNQEVDLQPGQTSDVLEFTLGAGEPVAGLVVDESGTPVGDAQVTAYKQRDDNERRNPLNFQIDPEDFDFFALSSATNRRSAMSDSKGRFVVTALEPGNYRFTARHPDMAKSSTKDVVVQKGAPTPEVVITLDAGGAVEGTVTGLGMRPLQDALMVAFSIQAGTMRSGTTNPSGFYRIDGLPPGQYIVFKSRLDERADNIPLELMSNMRLKTVTVRQGRTTQLDVHDESEDGVRVFGVVREAGAPVPRALVTMLGSDREGLLGMGVRANAAGMDGRYEIVGIKPGDYVMQVTRFVGQPVQTTFAVEVPSGVRDFVFDVSLPTSTLRGRVVDTRGNPVPSVMVTLGSDDNGLADADGMIGMIAQNGLSQARTNEEGEFTMRAVAAGTYRLTANGAFGGGGGPRGRRGAAATHGEGKLEQVIVDGAGDVEGLLVTLPLAGRITGIVVDGSGVPVQNAEIAYASSEPSRRKKASNPLLDLVGAQARPIRTGDDGRFEIPGVTPGVYGLRVESEALEAGTLDDVRVFEDQASEVTLRVVRGATLRVRATNVAKEKIPFGYISLLDGRGKPIVSRVSTLTVMRRLMSGKDTVDDSGWYQFGSVPPDTYTAVITEPNQPEIRITRTIRDGEVVEWDIDVTAELEARERAKK
jgi:protocatechuate 3,4-dioxygenase beta subunit